MRASVDADGCCTRALARPARLAPAGPSQLPCAVGLLVLGPALLLICFDLIWSSLCHHQPSPDSRSFLWEVIRGTNHPSLNSKSRARNPPPVGPIGVVWRRVVAHRNTHAHRARDWRGRGRRAGGQQEACPGLLYFVAAVFLSDVGREMATARF